jgi:hypothetical protein
MSATGRHARSRLIPSSRMRLVRASSRSRRHASTTSASFHNEDGTERFESRDAYYFLNEWRGRKIKPQLCDHGLSMRIKYTGVVPEGFERGRPFTFMLSFQGPRGESLKGGGK